MTEQSTNASDSGSVTEWLHGLRAGDQDAATDLWNRYIESLIRLAQAKLVHTSRRVADEEDVAVEAFNAFLRGVQSNRFPQLQDRSDLWQILAMLTERRAADQIRRDGAQKRGGGRVRGESVFEQVAQAGGIGWIADGQPTPEFAALVADECRQLMQRLNDSTLQKVAIEKMEGRTVAEIAERLGKSRSSIERKLRLIRQLWCDEQPGTLES